MVVDGTELYQQAIARIQQLEKLNATLAAQVDRMAPVVHAAQAAVGPSVIHASLIRLAETVDAYSVAMAQLAQEGR